MVTDYDFCGGLLLIGPSGPVTVARDGASVHSTARRTPRYMLPKFWVCDIQVEYVACFRALHRKTW